MDNTLISNFINYKKRAATTANLYENTLNEFSNFVQIELISVKSKDITKYKESLLKPATIIKGNKEVYTRYEESTVLKKLRIIHSFYMYLIDRKYIKQNPFIGVLMPKQDRFSFDKDRILSHEEFDKLLNSTDSIRDKVIILLAGICGFKPLEISSGLKYNSFFEDATGRIGATVKTRRQRDGKTTRIIPVRKDVANLINKLMYENKKNFPGYNEESQLFVNRYGKALSSSYINKLLTKLLDKAGIDKKISLKDLTHFSVVNAIHYNATTTQLMQHTNFSSDFLLKKYKYAVEELKDPACDLINFEIDRSD
jgi:site-specific recombinase XerD